MICRGREAMDWEVGGGSISDRSHTLKALVMESACLISGGSYKGGVGLVCVFEELVREVGKEMGTITHTEAVNL